MSGGSAVRARRIPQTGARGYTAPMNRCLSPRLKSLCLALVLPFALAACGNKGPLVLPDRPAPDAKAETPVEPAADAPAPAETPAAESPPPPGR